MEQRTAYSSLRLASSVLAYGVDRAHAVLLREPAPNAKVFLHPTAEMQAERASNTASFADARSPLVSPLSVLKIER